MNEIIDTRNTTELATMLNLAQHTVYKRYLPELEQYPLVQPTETLLNKKASDCIRFLKLEELSCKQGEDIFQKLSTVYYASMALGCNLIVMVDVEKIGAPAKLYIGVRNNGEDEEDKKRLRISYSTLKNGLQSNFPGTKFKDIPSNNEMPELIEDIFGNATKYISSVSCVASIRDKSKTENKSFIQGLERFIDTMRGNTYTALFIAEPITTEEQMNIRSGYENLYSVLSPFSKSVWSYNETESTAVMESLSESISDSITEGTNQTQSHTKSMGANIGFNMNSSSSQETSHSSSNPTNTARIGSAIAAVSELISTAYPPVSIIGAVVGGIMQGGSVTEGVVNTIGKSLGISGGFNGGISKSDSETTLNSKTKTNTTTRTNGTTDTASKGKTLQIENINKSIEQMLKRIEEQLKRTQECEDYGAYSCAAYFLSGKQESSLLAADTYRALMIGEGSSIESNAINTWSDSDKVNALKAYLKHFIHPIFAMGVSVEPSKIRDIMIYTPGTIVSGLELPLHLGIPTKSVYGLPVLEYAEFGRNVVDKVVFNREDTRRIEIGQVYHMGQAEKNAKVSLNVEGLTAHTFITGSTGSGKSNTIYQMLDQLNEQSIHFLVVEPTKGEYKKEFGNRENVTVYSTNPKILGTELLRINPFSFPDNIHVLEHLDRLIEIFNVCWPMYAAMPAVLKDAIERAYEKAGWDMELSENRYNNRLYPTFTDVCKQIKAVLEESEYSQDNKGDYKGALETRLKSLTNGINGLIFTPDEIFMKDLFDKNVIVDLSRVGSTETKSFIMGLLVLKLQEYRMNSEEPNQKLHHVTVLEEAHQLLRKTSVEQSTEGSNLLGKSVEMLANSIAEMRTYGEGFIIADQSPGLLDMSVIRNTNTKIILRLPDYSDRELVGRAAGLNEEQIIELAKLDNGVAAIKQSEWLEAVLCKIDKFTRKTSTNNKERAKVFIKPKLDIKETLLNCLISQELKCKGNKKKFKA